MKLKSKFNKFLNLNFSKKNVLKQPTNSPNKNHPHCLPQRGQKKIQLSVEALIENQVPPIAFSFSPSPKQQRVTLTRAFPRKNLEASLRGAATTSVFRRDGAKLKRKSKLNG